MTDLGELSIKLSEACNDLEKLMAVDCEISNGYFDAPEKYATAEMLKCNLPRYRTLHYVVMDYIDRVNKNVAEVSDAIDELWQAEAGRKPGEPVKQR